MYDQYRRWPEFQFKHRQRREDGTFGWAVYMTDETGIKARLVCYIEGKTNAWTIPAYDGTTSQPDLGKFKRREDAAKAFLNVTQYEPETAALAEKYKDAWRTNASHPKDVPYNKGTANALWDIVVQECGANECEREHFVYDMTTHPAGTQSEWRFQGAIGFGGKLYFSYNRWYVGCYNEEETPYVKLMIAEANARLQDLHVANYGSR